MNLPTVLLMFITRVFGEKAGNAAKAILPATGTTVAVVAQWVATGTFDRAEAITAGTGLGASLLAYLVPNLKDRLQGLSQTVLSDSHVVLTQEQYTAMHKALADATAALTASTPPPAPPAAPAAPTEAAESAPDPLTDGPLDDLEGADADPPPLSDEDEPADVPGMGDDAAAPTTASQQ